MINLVRLVSVLMISVGLGMLAYGVMVDPERYEAPLGMRWLFSSPAATLAWGIGMFVFGVLVMMMFGIRMAPIDRPEDIRRAP